MHGLQLSETNSDGLERWKLTKKKHIITYVYTCTQFNKFAFKYTARLHKGTSSYVDITCTNRLLSARAILSSVSDV